MPIKGSTVFLRLAGDTRRRILHATTVTETVGGDGYRPGPHFITLRDNPIMNQGP